MKEFKVEFSEQIASKLAAAAEITNIKEEDLIKWTVFEFMSQK